MISGNDYLTISTLLGEADTLGTVASDFLDSQIEVLSNTKTPDNLSNEPGSIRRMIENTQLLMTNNHINLSSKLSAVVSKLQLSVIGSHGSVNAFLSSRNILVTQDFATLSSKCGYPIFLQYVES